MKSKESVIVYLILCGLLAVAATALLMHVARPIIDAGIVIGGL